MRNLIFILFAVFTFCGSSFSQIKVYPVEKKKLHSRELSEEAMQKLRQSQTVFFYRSEDDLLELRKALEDVWTISELFLFPYSEIGKINLKGKSYFVIEGFRRITSKHTTVDNTYLYLHLYMNFTDKKGKEFKQTFARLDLFPSVETQKEIYKKDEDKVIDYLYTDAEIKNWQPGFLRNYIRTINDLLEQGGHRGLYHSDDEVPAITELANKTLYIPDYALTKMSMLGGEASQQDPADLLRSYPHSYEIKSASEISNMVLEGEDFYYLVYTRSSSEKYFTVYHSLSGEIVFHAYKPMSYNLKDSDFKDIAKSVEKMTRKARK